MQAKFYTSHPPKKGLARLLEWLRLSFYYLIGAANRQQNQKQPTARHEVETHSYGRSGRVAPAKKKPEPALSFSARLAIAHRAQNLAKLQSKKSNA